MNNQTRILLPTILFFIAAIADVYGIIFANETVKVIAKPMLLTLLVVVYLVAVKEPLFWYVLGMFLCFIGDVLLMFNGANFFMFGLAAFLLGHVVYIKVTSMFLPSNITMKMISSAFPFVVFFAVLMYVLYPNLEELQIPVFVYGITISTFGAIALLNYRSEKSTENLWLLIGALLFILSDSILALNKFYKPNEIYAVAIMVTYILAQFLICKAMIVKTNAVVSN
ncbi:MAG: lysoplasmalogenase [Polaribacter sp.]|nr:lysoplasmalogenase [Polaribacter sp.]MDG1811440.1 lysoplasmalogenase [Polaribacter sp.]MDG1993649.1 lysoplasmalogenase [Polaribacter sp.]